MHLSNTNFKPTPNTRAFTLVELLAVIAIISVLAALAMAGLGKIREHAKQTTEISAARNLITAYNVYSSENKGRLMPGQDDLFALKSSPVYNLQGQKLSYPVNARYPWRLAPYLGGVEGALLINESIIESEKWRKSGNYDYMVSAYPSLGINGTYIGTASVYKNAKGETLGYNDYSVQHAANVVSPGRLIVFASAAGGDEQGELVHGYLEVRAPYDAVKKTTWPSSPEDPKEPIMDHVHLRWNGRAVVAHLDGNVTLLNETELRDMRRWANPAAQANNPDWAGN